MEVRIIFIDGQVKHIWSLLLFELRSLDNGFSDYSKEEIEEAKKQKRVLLVIKDSIIELVYCPEGSLCFVNDVPLKAYFE